MKTMLRVFLFSLLCIPVITRSAPVIPVLVAEFTSDKTKGCVSLLINFTDQSLSSSGDPVVGWLWDFGDGDVSTSQNPSHTFTAEGLYDVSLEITTQSGLKKTAEKYGYISAGNLPLIDLGKDTAICEGSSIQLNAGNIGSAFLWSTGQITGEISAANEDKYYVTVDRFGCMNSDTININFRPNITPDYSFNITTGCLPAAVEFTDHSVVCSGSTVTGWLWNFGDGNTSTEQNPVHTYTYAGLFLVKLTVTDNMGSSSVKNRQVTITASDPPVVHLGADTIICSGASIFLDATNTGATYLWSTGETSPVIETYIPGEYTVDVTLNSCVVKDTIYVDTAPIIYADFDFDQSSTTCLPVVTSFTEFSQSCTSNIVGWDWDFGDGAVSTEANPVHNYTTAGVYDVLLTVKNGVGNTYTATKQVIVTGVPGPVLDLRSDTTVCEGIELVLSAENPGADYLWSNGEVSQTISVYDPGKYSVVVTKNGCTVEDSIHVTIVAALATNFSFVKLSSCLPVTMKFTDRSTSCSGAIAQWKWDFGDGTTSTMQHPEHGFTSAGDFNVRLRITDDNGVSLSRTIKVTIDPLTKSVSLGSDTTICFGSTLTLDAGNPGADYLWSTGETSSTIEVLDAGQYRVRVQILGCEAYDTINVYSANAANTKWGYKVNAACLPVVVDFTDSSQVFCGQAIARWEWDFGDGTSSNEQHPHHSYMTADSFTVRLFITNTGGATFSKTQKIGIKNTIPQANMEPSLRVCMNSTVELDAGIADAEYSWTPSSGLSADDIRNPTFTARLNGWYKVDINKCMVAIRDSIYITVDSTSKPVIRQEGNLLTAPPSTGYQWYRDGQALVGSINATARVDRQGFYTVKIANQAGCTNESDPYFFIPISSKDKSIEGIRIKCSPNPSSGTVNLLLSEVPQKGVIITLLDRSGVRLLTTTLRNHVTTLDLAKYSRGLYFIEAIVNNKKKIISIVLF